MQDQLLLRFQFAEGNLSKGQDLKEKLQELFGAGIHWVADGTILLDGVFSVEAVYGHISSMFTFDDKLFIAGIHGYKSLHGIGRTGPPLRKAI